MHVNTSIFVVAAAAADDDDDDGGGDDVLLPPPVRFGATNCDCVAASFGIDIGNRKLSLVSMSQMRTDKSPMHV